MDENSDEGFLNLIRYFWESKGDITRCVSYSEERLAKLRPDILEAWKKYVAAEQKMNELVGGIF